METHCHLPLLIVIGEVDALGLHANFKDLQSDSDGTAEESVRTVVGLAKTTAVHLVDNLSMDNNMEGAKDSNATNLEVGGDIVPGVFLNFADYTRECDRPEGPTALCAATMSGSRRGLQDLCMEFDPI